MSRKTNDSRQVDQYIGQRIRYFRLQRGLSQQELAEQLGISYQQLHKYENGSNSVSASRMAEIASLLQITVPTLFEGIESGESAELDAHTPTGAFGREQLQLLAYLSCITDPIKRATIGSLLHSLAEKGTNPERESA